MTSPRSDTDPPGANTKPIPDTVNAALAKAREHASEANTEVAEVVDAEIVEPGMSKAEALAITDRIRAALDDAWELIKQAYTRRVWAALGYESWDEFCDGELGTSRLRLPREERNEVVCSLRDAGMSIRAIEAATGLGYGTVRRELSGVGHPGAAALRPRTARGAHQSGVGRQGGRDHDRAVCPAGPGHCHRPRRQNLHQTAAATAQATTHTDH